MTPTAQGNENPTPYIYTLSNLPDYWIAEATDGLFYAVHNERGGWRRRCWYPGRTDVLRCVPPDDARDIIRFVGGYWGAVTIRTTAPIEIEERCLDKLLAVALEYASANV